MTDAKRTRIIEALSRLTEQQIAELEAWLDTLPESAAPDKPTATSAWGVAEKAFVFDENGVIATIDFLDRENEKERTRALPKGLQ